MNTPWYAIWNAQETRHRLQELTRFDTDTLCDDATMIESGERVDRAVWYENRPRNPFITGILQSKRNHA